MTTSTILLLFLSFGIAFVVSYYHYIYKAKNKSKMTLFLAFLRFLSVFGLLVLLINPIISRKSTEIEKTPLPIIIDNSVSVAELKANESALKIFNKLTKNSALNEKFEIQSFQFDSEMLPVSTVDFKGKQSNLDAVAKDVKNIYKNKTHPTVLITDGNQTSGEDYVYAFNPENKIYSVVLGDTTTFLDLKINQLNVNKYAFHKNKFPVEVFVNYAGTKNINATFRIEQGNNVINEQTLAFSPNKKSATVNVLLPADKIGVQLYKARITSKENEKNNYNNVKNFAVEILDQKTEIAIVSSINHPDLGALKRSIESNAQRKVTIVKPNELKRLDDYNVLVLYQPTIDFKLLFDANLNAKLNTFIITGNATDFNFLNQHQNSLVFKMTTQKEDFIASFDSQFNLFALDNIGFELFPPLENPFGTITTKENVNILLSSKIRNIPTNQPLMAFTDNFGMRNVFLLGENIWKWRAHSYIENKSFEKFDIFMDKTIQFLATNNIRKSLIVNHERFYNSGEALEISAQYFNKNYELDEKARLTINVTNTNTKKVKSYDLLRSATSFKVNLDGLPAGNYNFTVKELNSNSSYSGTFEVLDFDIEKQFVNPDLNKLKQLAIQTNGNVFMPNQENDLVKQLLNDENYKAVQKTIVKKSPLIDWIWLLIIIAVSLSSEWFIRKYNGML